MTPEVNGVQNLDFMRRARGKLLVALMLHGDIHAPLILTVTVSRVAGVELETRNDVQGCGVIIECVLKKFLRRIF